MEQLYSSGQNHCKGGRIKDGLRVGTNYLIPEASMKPSYVYLYESEATAKNQAEHWYNIELIIST